MADLLGTKLVAERVRRVREADVGSIVSVLSPRSYVLATYALTGFANFASIGIQLGGIGGDGPDAARRPGARSAPRALFAGFLATLINAAIASALL